MARIQNELFPVEKKNLLPFDGEVLYHGKILTDEQASFYFTKLLNVIDWRNDEVIIFGRKIITQRKVAWYGDSGFLYTYSNSTKAALARTTELKELKQLAEKVTGCNYNSCLLNLYHSGNEGMGWHSDDEDTLERNASIASLSLGAERKFSLKSKQEKHTVSIELENGSLLEMKGNTQQAWLHSLPKTKKISTPRINLTFRKFIG